MISHQLFHLFKKKFPPLELLLDYPELDVLKDGAYLRTKEENYQV